MSFVSVLQELLPADLPHRDRVIAGAARHLDLIVETNRQFNLTRIVEEREAVIKHVLDSIAPWQLFVGAAHVVDAGTGAGFPGIPLALLLPDTRFTLLESTQKKARFVEGAVADLQLSNVRVSAERAEAWLAANPGADIVTARAVAPLAKAVELFAPAIRTGSRILLYKGPDVEAEIAEAAPQLKRRNAQASVRLRYELPEGMGSRSMIDIENRDRRTIS